MSDRRAVEDAGPYGAVLPPPPGALGVPQCAHWGGGGTADGRGFSVGSDPQIAPPTGANVRQTGRRGRRPLRSERTSGRVLPAPTERTNVSPTLPESQSVAGGDAIMIHDSFFILHSSRPQSAKSPLRQRPEGARSQDQEIFFSFSLIQSRMSFFTSSLLVSLSISCRPPG